MRNFFFVLASTIAVLIPAGVQGDVISTFDASLEGWSATAGVTHSAAGGNPDGYARFDDPDGIGNSILAPAAFLGDWSIYEGGILSYDHRIFAASEVNALLDYEIEISGPTDSAVWTSEGPDGTTAWVTLVALLQESEWSVVGDWSTLLANVTELRIRIELVDDTGGADTEGIDNVRLEAAIEPIPEPSSLGIVLGFAICGVGSMVIPQRRRGIQSAT